MAKTNSPKMKAQNPIKTLLRLLKYAFSRYKVAMFFVVVCVLFSATANSIGASQLAPIINGIKEQVQNGTQDFSGIYTNVIIMASVYLLGVIASFSYNRIMMYVAQGTLKRLRDETFAKMQRLPLKFFDQTTHGELMGRYTNDIDAMRELLGHSIPNVVSSLITIITVVSLMIYYSLTLALVIAVTLTITLFVVKYFGGRSAKYFIRQQKAIGALSGFIEEMTQGQKVVKVFCHEDKAKERFKELNDELCHSAYTANSSALVLGPINMNIGYLQYILVAIVGVIIIFSGNEGAFLSLYGTTVGSGFALGVVVSFLQFSRQINMPINNVTQEFNSVVMALAGAERVFEIVDGEPEDQGGNVTLTYGEKADGVWAWKKPLENGDFEYVDLKGDIRFFDVVFGYTDKKTVLKNISLYARPGQKIAFVGSTGAGKTTITNLINRFYDIQSGQITYDGIDVKDINKSDLRKSLGVVLQDTHLFSGTVMDNIRYGRLDATDEECISAARLANAHDFIKHLPDGYNTQIEGDGGNLSQGQRQLLSIARAMVSNCPVIILDEATSSIDTRTEKLIEEGMDKLMEGRTVFVIAHRLSTVRRSHAIMVLQDGEIIERGTHDQLIDMKGKYYQLYTGAFELE